MFSLKNQVLLSFIYKERRNRLFLLAFLIITALQFIVFKQFYPFADYGSDSYTYIDVALHQQAVSYRPVGYSHVLRILHAIHPSDWMVTGFQYVLLQGSILLFFFTLCLLFHIGQRTAVGLFCLLLFNPLSLYISNLIMSDALFSALSLLWFTQLLFIIKRPAPYQIVVQALLLLLVFKVRYAAMYYPAVTLLALLLSRQSVWLKVGGIALSASLIYIEIQRTEDKMQQNTGTRVFTGFSGWQIANNALHMYPYISVDSNALPSPECKVLNRMAKQYFDTVRVNHSQSTATANYMWFPEKQSPLKMYMSYYGLQKKNSYYFDNWTAVGPVFNQYGTHLVKKHPLAYARYYLVYNTLLYLHPELELLHQYNGGAAHVDTLAAQWFGYKNTQVQPAPGTINQSFLIVFVYLFTALNIIFFGAGIWLFVKRRQIGDSVLRKILLLTFFYMAANLAFNAFTAMVCFRYLYFTMVLLAGFCVVIALPSCRRQWMKPLLPPL